MKVCHFSDKEEAELTLAVLGSGFSLEADATGYWLVKEVN